MFSRRTLWTTSPNRLSRILEARRRAALSVLDLTVGNPTVCGFTYPENLILKAISKKEGLVYRPDPRGLLPARESLADLYRPSISSLDSHDIFLTSSTSESYSLLFRLLCDPGDTVLFPRPSYPLFDYLAGISDVEAAFYRLAYDGRWTLDTGSLNDATGDIPPGKLRAVVLVNPHNPTGMYIDRAAFDDLAGFAVRHRAALIMDEVFFDYPLSGGRHRDAIRHDHPELLMFTLNGLSKMGGLPQMKLGWIILSGRRDFMAAAADRMEILCDTYLSVNTPVQAGLPELLSLATSVREQIRARIVNNFSTLTRTFPPGEPVQVLCAEGGWSAVLRLPGGCTDEECAARLLDERGVYLYPGYFFDFSEDDLVVVSLLPGENEFRRGVEAMRDWLAESVKK